MSDPRPGHMFDPSDPRQNKEGYKQYKAKKAMAKKMSVGDLSKRFAKHANTFDRIHKGISKDIKKRGNKPIF